MKILKANFKSGTGIGKKIHTIECDKVNSVPKVMKITEMVIDERGKINRKDM